MSPIARPKAAGYSAKTEGLGPPIDKVTNAC